MTTTVELTHDASGWYVNIGTQKLGPMTMAEAGRKYGQLKVAERPAPQTFRARGTRRTQ